ncbi:MAG TPA: response regulator [Elusimicrobiales bacterium]|nr:response regulator [Elusimicrobiales bacterium]
MKDKSKKTVLIIDDSRAVTETLSAIFTMKGYEVISARNWVEGVEFAKRHKPNLILLDLMLPKLSGFDVCKIIRSDNSIWKTPIVVISTLGGDPEKVDRAKSMGVDHFISKPYDIEKIVEESLKFIR